MSETFSIKSTHSNRELIFSEYDGEDFRVEVKGSINAAIKVYGYAPHSEELVQWLNKLGNYTSPWGGELSWESLEGEFRIAAQCSSLGQIHIEVSLQHRPLSDETGFVQVELETEFGQLINISKQAGKFFAK